MSKYLVSVDAHDDVVIKRILNDMMLEKGATTISPGEWVLEADSNEAMSIYDGIAAVVGDGSVFVKELTSEPSWDNAVVSQDVLFDMLGCGQQPLRVQNEDDRTGTGG
jgi:hypothetical protein